jgi:hypothetical protein
MTVKEAKEIILKYEKLVTEAREVLAKHYSKVLRRIP